MKRRLGFLLVTFVLFLPLLAVQKPLFMLYHHDLSAGVPAGDWLRTIAHGLTLDLTVAGYLSLVPVLIVLVSIWWRGPRWERVLRVWFGLAAAVAGLVFAADLALYSYWGFRIDSTVFFYLASPRDAAASIEWGTALVQLLAAAVYGTVFYLTFSRLAIPVFSDDGLRGPLRRLGATGAILLYGGLLVLPIRGGLSASTANEGRAYFSPNMFLNHAAVNPLFSLMYSSFQTQRYADRYRYYDEPERALIWERVQGPTESRPAGTLLRTERPDILLVVLEGITAHAVGACGGDATVAPHLDALAREGIVFTDLYASSWRTDRGLVAVMNGYPGQPTTSIMKYPTKARELPAWPRTLRDAGYSTAMYYGGDIDFTNMRSYFYGAGFDWVTGQDGLRFDRKPARWGYDDALMAEYVGRQLGTLPRPFLAGWLTLSSHEPFDVPYDRLDDPYANSVAFTDEAIGRLVDSLRATPLWDNLLVILLSDHGYRWPADVADRTPERQHMPMIWVGGAVRGPMVYDRIASQTDLAATLLAELGLDAGKFAFSRDLLAPGYRPKAFWTFPNGFGYTDESGTTVWDCNTDTPLEERGAANPARAENGKALLQTLMEDFDRRGTQ